MKIKKLFEYIEPIDFKHNDMEGSPTIRLKIYLRVEQPLLGFNNKRNGKFEWVKFK